MNFVDAWDLIKDRLRVNRGYSYNAYDKDKVLDAIATLDLFLFELSLRPEDVDKFLRRRPGEKASGSSE